MAKTFQATSKYIKVLGEKCTNEKKITVADNKVT